MIFAAIVTSDVLTTLFCCRSPPHTCFRIVCATKRAKSVTIYYFSSYALLFNNVATDCRLTAPPAR